MTTPLTDAELAEIEQRLRAATPGEWLSGRMVSGDTGKPLTPEEYAQYELESVLKSAQESGTTDILFVICEKPDGPADVCITGNGPNSPNNTALIAHAPTDIQRLLDEVRRLRQRLEGAEAELAAVENAQTRERTRRKDTELELQRVKSGRDEALAALEKMAVWLSDAIRQKHKEVHDE